VEVKKGDITRDTAFGQWLTYRSSSSKGRRDAGDDFVRNANRFQRLQLFIGASEQHGVTAFESYDAIVAKRAGDQLLINECLRRGALTAALANRDQLSLRTEFENIRCDKRIMQNDLCIAQHRSTAHGNEVGCARAGAYQPDATRLRPDRSVEWILHRCSLSVQQSRPAISPDESCLQRRFGVRFHQSG
jgi:hypothetical protein